MNRPLKCAFDPVGLVLACSLGKLLPELRQGRTDRPTNPESEHPSRNVAVVAALALAPAIGPGIARFAYALVLPDTRADLGWSYADAVG